MKFNDASPITREISADNFQEKLKAEQLSMDDLIDVLGDIKERVKVWSKIEGYCKEMLSQRIPEGGGEFSTDHYALVAQSRERTALDTNLIKEEFADFLKPEHYKTTEYTELRVKRLEI